MVPHFDSPIMIKSGKTLEFEVKDLIEFLLVKRPEYTLGCFSNQDFALFF